MADERPDRSNEKGGSGPGDQGHGRRSGRRRGFRGRHGGSSREGAHEASGREGQGPKPREASVGAEDQQTARDNPQQRDQRPSRPEETRARSEDMRDMPSCPICGKPVYDLSTAITAARETGDPAHFDCVLERIAASETLATGEKLVYLGSGAFGVVEFKDKNESLFTVKRRIQWEKEGEKKDWRKGLSSRIANL
jgi:hypothetical protein